MTTTAQCPVCLNPQAQGLLDDACTTKLERALGDVRWIVTELDTAASKQAKIGNPSGGGGLARERNPISWGAVEAADTLGNVLTTWARDVAGDRYEWTPSKPAVKAAWVLFNQVDAIRRHPAVAELMDEITDAVEQARRAVDRPADRMYLGQCMTVLPDEDGNDVECFEEIWGRVDAHEAVCRVCGVTHEVAERRAKLLDKAKEVVCSVKQASYYMGDVGGLIVSESTIRSYVSAGEITYLGKVDGSSVIRLGDLLEVVAENSAKKIGKKLRRVSAA